MRLSRTVAYALQATLMLAREDGETPVPCSRLAAAGKMPERFLVQILRKLVAHGVLASTRGVDGGYVLGRPADRISLLDVIEAIDGPLVSIVPCTDGLPAQSKSRLVKALWRVTETTRRELREVSVAGLARKSNRGR